MKSAKHIQKKVGNLLPLAVQKKNLDEEIKHYKIILKKSIEKNNRPEIKRGLRELIKRRARLAVLNLQTYQENNFFISPAKKEEEIKNYFIQCYKLMRATALLARQSNGHR